MSHSLQSRRSSPDAAAGPRMVASTSPPSTTTTTSSATVPSKTRPHKIVFASDNDSSSSSSSSSCNEKEEKNDDYSIIYFDTGLTRHGRTSNGAAPTTAGNATATAAASECCPSTRSDSDTNSSSSSSNLENQNDSTTTTQRDETTTSKSHPTIEAEQATTTTIATNAQEEPHPSYCYDSHAPSAAATTPNLTRSTQFDDGNHKDKPCRGRRRRVVAVLDKNDNAAIENNTRKHATQCCLQEEDKSESLLPAAVDPSSAAERRSTTTTTNGDDGSRSSNKSKTVRTSAKDSGGGGKSCGSGEKRAFAAAAAAPGAALDVNATVLRQAHQGGGAGACSRTTATTTAGIAATATATTEPGEAAIPSSTTWKGGASFESGGGGDDDSHSDDCPVVAPPPSSRARSSAAAAAADSRVDAPFSATNARDGPLALPQENDCSNISITTSRTPLTVPPPPAAVAAAARDGGDAAAKNDSTLTNKERRRFRLNGAARCHRQHHSSSSSSSNNGLVCDLTTTTAAAGASTTNASAAASNNNNVVIDLTDDDAPNPTAVVVLDLTDNINSSSSTAATTSRSFSNKANHKALVSKEHNGRKSKTNNNDNKSNEDEVVVLSEHASAPILSSNALEHFAGKATTSNTNQKRKATSELPTTQLVNGHNRKDNNTSSHKVDSSNDNATRNARCEDGHDDCVILVQPPLNHNRHAAALGWKSDGHSSSLQQRSRTNSEEQKEAGTKQHCSNTNVQHASVPGRKRRVAMPPPRKETSQSQSTAALAKPTPSHCRRPNNDAKTGSGATAASNYPACKRARHFFTTSSSSCAESAASIMRSTALPVTAKKKMKHSSLPRNSRLLPTPPTNALASLVQGKEANRAKPPLRNSPLFSSHENDARMIAKKRQQGLPNNSFENVFAHKRAPKPTPVRQSVHSNAASEAKPSSIGASFASPRAASAVSNARRLAPKKHSTSLLSWSPSVAKRWREESRTQRPASKPTKPLLPVSASQCDSKPQAIPRKKFNTRNITLTNQKGVDGESSTSVCRQNRTHDRGGEGVARAPPKETNEASEDLLRECERKTMGVAKGGSYDEDAFIARELAKFPKEDEENREAAFIAQELAKFAQPERVCPYSFDQFMKLFDELQDIVASSPLLQGHTLDEIVDGSLIKQANNNVRRDDSINQERAQYGQLTWKMTKIIVEDIAKLKEGMGFVDIGHGIGNNVIQAAFTTGCAARGIELVADRYFLSAQLSELFHWQHKAIIRNSNKEHQVGSIEFELGSFEDPQFRAFLTEYTDVCICNNFNNVFKDKSGLKHTNYFLDDYLVGLFILMKPGAVLVTLDKLSMGPSKSAMCAHRRKHKMKEDDEASFFEEEEFFFEDTSNNQGLTSWKNCNKSFSIFKYTRTYKKDATFLCGNPECKLASEGIPIRAWQEVDGRIVLNSCDCGRPVKSLRPKVVRKAFKPSGGGGYDIQHRTYCYT